MSQVNPPKWADRFLGFILPEHLWEEIGGDLHEAFYWRLGEKSRSYANRMFIWESLRALQFTSQKTQNNYSIMLLINYLKTGVRFLWRTRAYASFNILGLAIGIAVVWLSAIYVTEEATFDNFHSNADRTYRIVADYHHLELHKVGGASYVMGEEYPLQIPAIELSSRFKSWYILLETGEGTVPYIAHRADEAITKIFDFHFLEGTGYGLDDPNSAIISESLAEKLFGDDETGDELSLYSYDGELKRFNILGVYKDFPRNSSIRPDVIVSMNNYANANPGRLSTWFDINMNVFITLAKGSNPSLVESEMTRILLENDDFENAEVAMKLQPLTDIHSSTEYETGNGINRVANQELILLVAIIGVICLVIASINFANYSVSNHLIRLKEVAIRKVIGAARRKIITQFVVETILASLIAFILSILILLIITPLFSEYANKSYSLMTFFEGRFLLVGFAILFVVSIFTGSYPGLILSRYHIISGLKGKINFGKKGFINRSFITIQFSLAVFLITGMIVFSKQLDMMMTFDLGYNDENIIQLYVPKNDEVLSDRVRSEINSMSGVQGVARYAGSNRTSYKDEDVEFNTYHNRVDPNYLSLLNIPVVSGRDFNASNTSDLREAVIINETFARMAKLEDPIGTRIPFKYGDLKDPVVIGIVKDYHFLDLSNNMQPMILYLSPQYRLQHMLIKGESANLSFIDELDQLWRNSFSPHPFNYELLTQLNNDQYESEKQVRTLTQAGAGIAIILACMGLIGIVGANVRQRMKEVSIRKVNGASPAGIFGLFFRRYVYFTVLGLVVGILGAYKVLQTWLEKYIVQTEVGVGVFLLAISIVSALALVTIFSQLFRAMYLNPTVYLRDE